MSEAPSTRSTGSSSVRLRPLHVSDEHALRQAQAIMAEEAWDFLLDVIPGEPWNEFVERRAANRRGQRLTGTRVPETFLVAEVGGVIVGRTSIRHELNEFLVNYGGHIGYGVLPAFRRRGYATEILRQSLIVIRSYGVDRVLVTCDDDNVASFRAIERCGGVFDSYTYHPNGHVATRRYWIS